MITAWQIYWVMQLDDIRIFIRFVFGGLAVGIVAFSPFWLDEEDWHVAVKRTAIGTLLMLFLSVMIPSTKTAAAMIVLPAITSDKVIETVTPEARELYELAKDALRSVSKKEAAVDAPKDAAK